jgi:hypothetical protein
LGHFIAALDFDFSADIMAWNSEFWVRFPHCLGLLLWCWFGIWWADWEEIYLPKVRSGFSPALRLHSDWISFQPNSVDILLHTCILYNDPPYPKWKIDGCIY